MFAPVAFEMIDVIAQVPTTRDPRGTGTPIRHGRAHRHALRRAGALDHRDATCRTTPPTRSPPASYVGPACVIDITPEVAANDGLSCWTWPPLERMGGYAWPHPARRVGPAENGMEPAHRSRHSSTFANDGPHGPGFDPADLERCSPHERDVLGVGVETIGTDAGQAGTVGSAVSESQHHARPRQVWPGQSLQSQSIAADRRRRDCGAIEARRREWKSGPGNRTCGDESLGSSREEAA